MPATHELPPERVVIPPTPPYPLGRRKAKDERDRLFLMTVPKRAPVSAPDSRIWTARTVLNQEDVPACVGFSWAGFSLAAPLMFLEHPWTGLSLYYAAQDYDEWDGNNYDGSSVRGGAAAMLKNGLITEYQWAWTVDVVKVHILTRGPVVVGTSWYEEMFEPKEHGGYLVPKGGDYGGHAWLVVGYSKTRNAFRMLNSWGRQWGEEGRAWIRYADLGMLIQDDGGEACSAIQAPRLRTAA